LTREVIAAPGRPAEPATIVASQVRRRDRDQASRPNGPADLLQSTAEFPEVLDPWFMMTRSQPDGNELSSGTLYALDVPSFERAPDPERTADPAQRAARQAAATPEERAVAGSDLNTCPDGGSEAARVRDAARGRGP
jgi:hypothetical protein